MRKLNLFSTLVALLFATLPLKADLPEGALPGMFTINSNCDMVYFSQGNLQYIGSASTPYWKFADHQYDYFGTTNGQFSAATNVDRDLFGWGTKTNPWNTSTNDADYSWNEWGENAISNGGNTANSGWRTLTKDEWVYILYGRSNMASMVCGSRIGFTKATVNGVAGLILFPDGGSFVSSDFTYFNKVVTSSGSFSEVVCNATKWAALEARGCVFLPAALERDGTSQCYPSWGTRGWYWSSTDYGQYNWSYRMNFYSDQVVSSNSMNKRIGMSVRLVKVVPDESKPVLVASATNAPTAASNWTYDGNTKYLLTAAASGVTGGTVMYRLGTSGDWQTSYNHSSIRATNAGTYTVQWYVKHSGCYLDSEIESIEVTIARKSAGVAAPSPMPTVDAASLTYNGTPQDLVTATGSLQSGYTLVYSTDGVNWSEDIPQGTNAGDYTVYYKFYKGANEEYVPSPNTIDANIAQADLPGVTLPEATSTIPYDGTEKTLLEIDPVANATIWYKLGDGDWTTTPPTATDADDYSVQYKIVPNDAVNYNTIGPNTVTVTILDYPTVYDVNVDPTAKLTELLNTPSDLKIKRTIYADGEYNTICLPFSLDASALAASPLAGFDRLKTFRGAKVTGTAPDLSIDIFVEDATTIEAGIPYLMTYPVGDNIVDPVFHDVTVTTTTPSATSADGVTFQGMFAQVHIDPYASERDEDYLFLGANSQLMWPASSQTDSSIKMRGFRAYFIIDRNSISPALAPKGTRARIVDAPKTATGIENASATFGGSEKILENGVLYIIRNGVRYNAQGQVVK